VDVDEDNINSENLREDSIVQTDIENLPEDARMLAPIQSESPMFPELATTQPSSTSKSLAFNWHRRLGHVALTTLKKLSSIDIDTPSIDCEACIFAKSRKNPFKVRDPSTFATVKLQRIHSDLCHALIPSIGKSKYYVVFIDELARYCWVYTLRDKSAATLKQVFDQWCREAENQAGTRVQSFQTDGGGEYEREMKIVL